MTKSLEDYAAMRLAGEHIECLCDEFASLILEKDDEIKALREALETQKRETFTLWQILNKKIAV